MAFQMPGVREGWSTPGGIEAAISVDVHDLMPGAREPLCRVQRLAALPAPRQLAGTQISTLPRRGGVAAVRFEHPAASSACAGLRAGMAMLAFGK